MPNPFRTPSTAAPVNPFRVQEPPATDWVDAIQSYAPPEEEPKLGVGEMLGSAVKNIPSSGWQFLKDVTAPVHSPKQTLEGVGNMALGAAQKLIPGEQGSEQYADAMGRFFKERYGGSEEIKRTLAEDPVGLVGDVAGLFTGGGALAAKGAGLAGRAGGNISRIGKAASKIGRALEPTVLGAKAGAKVASKFGGAIAEILGITGGISSTPIKVTFASGYAGGRQGKMFVDSHATARSLWTTW